MTYITPSTKILLTPNTISQSLFALHFHQLKEDSLQAPQIPNRRIPIIINLSHLIISLQVIKVHIPFPVHLPFPFPFFFSLKTTNLPKIAINTNKRIFGNEKVQQTFKLPALLLSSISLSPSPFSPTLTAFSISPCTSWPDGIGSPRYS